MKSGMKVPSTTRFCLSSGS